MNIENQYPHHKSGITCILSTKHNYKLDIKMYFLACKNKFWFTHNLFHVCQILDLSAAKRIVKNRLVDWMRSSSGRGYLSVASTMVFAMIKHIMKVSKRGIFTIFQQNLQILYSYFASRQPR